MGKVEFQSVNELKNSLKGKESYYSIKDLEKLTGIKAHTIRIWEKRYSIINPKRTETNIRYYTDEDLKKIMMISTLNNNGEKISKIASLDLESLTKKFDDVATQNNEMEIFIDQIYFICFVLDYNFFLISIMILNNKRFCCY